MTSTLEPQPAGMEGGEPARRLRWRIERRTEVSLWWNIAAVILAVLAAFLVSAILLLTAKANPLESFGALFEGAFGSWRAITETLVKATPLILTGLATVIAFRARVWNIGQEGQLFIGAMAGYFAFTLFEGLPRLPLILLICLFAVVGGGAYGWLAAFLKTHFRVDEIISTVMLNYIAIFFLSFMLSGIGPWREEGSYYQQSAAIPDPAHFFLLLPGYRLHLGFALAVLSAVLIWVLLEKTPLGYEIRAFGDNPTAARFKGTNTSAIVMITMAISGGLSGLAGASELFGVHHRLVLDLSTGLGYTGIIVGMLAWLNPLGVVLAGILFGALTNGAFRLQIISGVPTAFIEAIQAIVLLFVLSASVLSRYRIRRVEDAG
jgi:ABC-type uncharacterized transport system permease subunit